MRRDDMPTVPPVMGRLMDACDIRPPCAIAPGQRYRRRDGYLFDQCDEARSDGCFTGDDGVHRLPDGRAIGGGLRHYDAVSDLGPIEVQAPADRVEDVPPPAYPEAMWLHTVTRKVTSEKPVRPWEWQDYVRADLMPAPVLDPADPYSALEWRTVAGEQVAIVPCWGERPDGLRDDDAIKLRWSDRRWTAAGAYLAGVWADGPAVILRRRPATVVLPTRYTLGPDGKPVRCTCGCAEIVEGGE